MYINICICIYIYYCRYIDIFVEINIYIYVCPNIYIYILLSYYIYIHVTVCTKEEVKNASDFLKYLCHQTKQFIEETTTTKHISYISNIDVQSIQHNKGRQHANIVQNINIIQTLTIETKAK